MTNNAAALSKTDQFTLLQIAGEAICSAASERRQLLIDATVYPAPLQRIAACFVTLTIQDKLRGCIGTLEAREPLVSSVAHNAYAAAVDDYRFNPLQIDELPCLHYHISVLSPATALPVSSEADLLDKLRPDIDGLILRWGAHQATFLPSVWDQLADPCDFLRQLKLKAGLAADFWSDDLEFYHYTTNGFAATLGAQPLVSLDLQID